MTAFTMLPRAAEAYRRQIALGLGEAMLNTEA